MPSTIMAPCVRLIISDGRVARDERKAESSLPSLPTISIENVRGFGSLRPDDFLHQLAVLLLPLGKHHLVTDLQAVFLGSGREFGAAEHGGDIHLVEDVDDLGLIERAGLLDGMLEQKTRRIAG